MALGVYTPSMEASATVLVENAHTWTRGVVKRTGARFVIFPSSKPGAAHYASADACTCRSWNFRLACSHVLAVRKAGFDTRPRCYQRDCDNVPTRDGEGFCADHMLYEVF